MFVNNADGKEHSVVSNSSKKLNTKELILEKSIDLFYKQGFASASIREIVKAVGVTNSTVYIHFKDKYDILYVIIDEIGKTLIDTLHNAVKDIDDPVECLRRMIFAQVCLIKDKRKEIKIYMEEQYQLPKTLKKKVLKQHRMIYDIYYDKLTEIKDNGLLIDVNQTVITFSIFALINWAYRWFNEKGPLSIEDVAIDTVRIVFSGIFKEVPFTEKDAGGANTVASLSKISGTTIRKRF